MAICAAMLSFACVTACGAADALPGDDPLDPLHGPIDPAVLDQPLDRPAPPPIPAADGAGWRVAAVPDGQTLELFQGLQQVTATIGGIRAPTGDECLAQLATDSLAFITGGGREVEVTPPNATSGLIVDALVRNADGDDVGLVMVTLGLAEARETVGFDLDAYLAAETQARDEGVGIWSDDCT